MKEIIITINDQEVTIKKLPLGKYAELLKSVKELPKHLDKIDGKSQKEILENIPFLLSECSPDIFRLIHITTGLDLIYIENELGMDDFVEIISAVLTVNNYGKIYSKIKKGFAHLNTETPTLTS